MFDIPINLVIVLVPLAIFIGRIVVAARKKIRPTPKTPAPVQVKKEDDDLPHWLREPAQAAKTPAVQKNKASRKLFQPLKKAGDLAALLDNSAPVSAAPEGRRLSEPAISDSDGSRRRAPVMEAAARNAAAKTPLSNEKAAPSGPGLFNLNRLSPLKQAVVMAEILGPPKGLQ